MPEQTKKNQDLQLLIDNLQVKDENNHIYFFTIKVGKYYSPESERTILSHIDNKNATGVSVLLEYIEKAKAYEFDFIEIELYNKYKSHELEAQKPYEKQRIIVNELPKPHISSNGSEEILGIVEEKLSIREAIMTKDFEIAQLRLENKKLKNNLQKAAIKVDELKTFIKKLKNRYFKSKKTFQKTKEQTEKEIENLKDDVKFKKLVSNGLGTLAANLKFKGHDIGSLLGNIIDLDNVESNQNSENQNNLSENQNFNVRAENQENSDELDQLKHQMTEQIKLYLSDKNEKTCTDFYSVIVYLTKDNNLKTILDLIS